MGFFGKRKERRLAALEEYRQVRRLVAEDVTVLGEQLSDLHVETLTTGLDGDMRHDYQRALDLYEDAKAALSAAEDSPAVREVEPLLDEGRFHMACVLARRDDAPLPTRRDPCFFNPQHGPAFTDVLWTPPHGAERRIPVCSIDASRLDEGEQPDLRMVRVGDRFVPWYAAEPLKPWGAFSSAAASGGHRGHLIGTRDYGLADMAATEAHMRSAASGSSGLSGPFG
jgi:hypothetical protein